MEKVNLTNRAQAKNLAVISRCEIEVCIIAGIRIALRSAGARWMHDERGRAQGRTRARVERSNREATVKSIVRRRLLPRRIEMRRAWPNGALPWRTHRRFRSRSRSRESRTVCLGLKWPPSPRRSFSPFPKYAHHLRANTRLREFTLEFSFNFSLDFWKCRVYQLKARFELNIVYLKCIKVKVKSNFPMQIREL